VVIAQYYQDAWIGPRLRRKCALQIFQEVANLRAGPVLRAYEFAFDITVLVDGVGLRPHVGVEELGCGLGGVAHGDEVYMMPREEGRVGVGVVVNTDADDDQAGHVAMKLKERGQLLDAGRAVAPPEVEQHGMAAVAGEMDGGRAVGDGEVGRGQVELRRVRTAVAGGHERQREQKQKNREPG
jgi:hypothetical protein